MGIKQELGRDPERAKQYLKFARQMHQELKKAGERKNDGWVIRKKKA